MSVLICLPAALPFPFPYKEAGSFYVVPRGLFPGIYPTREQASQQLVEPEDYFERALGWNAAWHVWMCHCHHRHDHYEGENKVNLIEEILDEPLSEPLSPASSWADLPSIGCASAGTPPPSPASEAARCAEFVAELCEALEFVQNQLGEDDIEDVLDDTDNFCDDDARGAIADHENVLGDV